MKVKHEYVIEYGKNKYMSNIDTFLTMPKLQEKLKELIKDGYGVRSIKRIETTELTIQNCFEWKKLPNLKRLAKLNEKQIKESEVNNYV